MSVQKTAAREEPSNNVSPAGPRTLSLVGLQIIEVVADFI
jgi:hypothetical protein